MPRSHGYWTGRRLASRHDCNPARWCASTTDECCTPATRSSSTEACVICAAATSTSTSSRVNCTSWRSGPEPNWSLLDTSSTSAGRDNIATAQSSRLTAHISVVVMKWTRTVQRKHLNGTQFAMMLFFFNFGCSRAS